ncbi:MAG: DUF4157 domain-containing protein [Jatrophihabitantaceae bacterium]
MSGLSTGHSLRRRFDAAEADPLGGTAIAADVVTTLRRQRGGGQPLPEGLRRAGSEALGRDLSPVRVHTGAEAARLARSVQASAFTYGHDIYFSAGAYRPGEAAGQQLISHELGHIGQDSGGTGGVIGRADDPAEKQADRAATGVLAALRRQAVRVDLAQGQADSERAETGATDRVVSALRRHAVPLAPSGWAAGKVIRRAYTAEDRPLILGLPQIANSDERVDELGAFNWSRAATVTMAQHAPAPTYEQMRAIMSRVKATEVGELREVFGNWADLTTLAGLGWRGADLNVLLHSEWQAADILALAQAGLQYTPQQLKALAVMPLGGQFPTVAQLNAIGRFTFDQLMDVIYSPDNNGSFQDWNQLVHLAEINGDEAVLVVGAGLADLATQPWLEDQVAHLAEDGHAGEKANVAGAVDTRFTCWQWATRGFETAPVSIDLLNRYFGFRTNYPPVFGVLDHAAATEAALSEPPASVQDREAFLAVERGYLNDHQAEMQAIITNWETEAGEDNGRNRDAQRAIMELQLANAGFDVLPAGTQARWYICMHERQTNVSWEHWWIRSRNGDVIETFPQNAGGGGLALNFHRLDVNMGDVDIDFRHEVPVRDLLPAQKTIIKREVERQNLPYTDDLL